MSEGVKRFENGLAEGKYPEDKILFINDYILQKKIGIMIAMYSKGDPVEYIRRRPLVKKWEVTNKTVSRWETGTYMPPVECLVLLSDIYGVSINEIVAGQRLSETEFTNAAEDNLSEALLLSENIYKQREKKLMPVMLISTVIAIILIFLIPISKDNMIRSMITVLLIIGLAVISNALNLVALAQNKERCEKKE